MRINSVKFKSEIHPSIPCLTMAADAATGTRL
jgi:hypothetical protein